MYICIIYVKHHVKHQTPNETLLLLVSKSVFHEICCFLTCYHPIFYYINSWSKGYLLTSYDAIYSGILTGNAFLSQSATYARLSKMNGYIYRYLSLFFFSWGGSSKLIFHQPCCSIRFSYSMFYYINSWWLM